MVQLGCMLRPTLCIASARRMMPFATDDTDIWREYKAQGEEWRELTTIGCISRQFRVKVLAKCFDKRQRRWGRRRRVQACRSCKRHMSGSTLPRYEFKITHKIYRIPIVLLLTSSTDNGSWPFDNVLAKIVSLMSFGAQFRSVWFSAIGLFDVVISLKRLSSVTSVPLFVPPWEGPGWELIF